jgi:hypothetical protein
MHSVRRFVPTKKDVKPGKSTIRHLFEKEIHHPPFPFIILTRPSGRGSAVRFQACPGCDRRGARAKFEIDRHGRVLLSDPLAYSQVSGEPSPRLGQADVTRGGDELGHSED